MGLDTVELLWSFEKYFNLEVPAADAERMGTVGQVAAWMGWKLGIPATRRESAVRVAVAARLRELLPAPPDTPVLQLIPNKYTHTDVAAKLLASSRLVLPPLSFTKRQVPGGWLAALLGEPVPTAELALAKNTLADLIDWTVATNYKRLLPMPLRSQYEVEQAVIGLTVHSSGVDVFEVTLGSSFTDDLGMD